VESLSIMPDCVVPYSRRAVATSLLAAWAASLLACSSGHATDETWKTEKAYGTEMARKGFWREALFRYEKAAALHPSDAQIQNNLAVAYESIGDTARALSSYKRALELAPQDSKIKRNYARFAEYYTSVQRTSSLPMSSSPAATPTAKPEAPGSSLPKPSGGPPPGPGPETQAPPVPPGPAPVPPAVAPPPAPAPVAPSPAPTPPGGPA
jgi:hypothetical protein